MSIENPSVPAKEAPPKIEKTPELPPLPLEEEESPHEQELETARRVAAEEEELEAVHERLGIDSQLIPRPEDLDYFKDERSRINDAREQARWQQERAAEILAWYRKAEEKAKEVAAQIDPNLSVERYSADITFGDDNESIQNMVLSFSHTENPRIRWTMSIEPTEEYIEQRLGPVIKKIYEGKTGAAENREQEDADDSFGDQQFAELEGIERQKRQDELAMIDLVNEATNKLREYLKFEGIDVPDRVVHLVPEEKWQGTGSASFVEERNAILIKSPEKLQIFKKKLIHEMLHLKSSNILPKFLNEALVEGLTKRMMRRVGDDILTSRERAESEALLRRYPDHRTNDGDYLFSEDTFLAYVGKDGALHSENFTYSEERELFDRLLDRIYEGGRFKSREAVFKEFARASFGGNPRDFEFIDETFGPGTAEHLLKGNRADLEKMLLRNGPAGQTG